MICVRSNLHSSAISALYCTGQRQCRREAHFWNSLASQVISSSRWSQCTLGRLGSGAAGMGLARESRSLRISAACSRSASSASSSSSSACLSAAAFASSASAWRHVLSGVLCSYAGPQPALTAHVSSEPSRHLHGGMSCQSCHAPRHATGTLSCRPALESFSISHHLRDLSWSILSALKSEHEIALSLAQSHSIIEAYPQ